MTAIPNNASGTRAARLFPLRPDIPVFGWAAPEYFYSGLGAPIPLPVRKKAPPPRYYTGRLIEPVTRTKVRHWARRRKPRSNLALRLAPGIVGIDVDDYDGKRGGETIQRLQLLHGVLPATVTSTSRDDGVSRVYLFRIPEKLRPRARELTAEQHDGTITGDVELIYQTCRYLVCWPSLHPHGGRYRWFGHDGQRLQHIPGPQHLAELPESWIPRLQQPSPRSSRRKDTRMHQDPPPTPKERSLVRSQLNSAAAAIRTAAPGSRNASLNRQAYTLAGHAHISDDEIRNVLGDAASAAGLSEDEIRRTLNSAIRAGRRRPLKR